MMNLASLFTILSAITTIPILCRDVMIRLDSLLTSVIDYFFFQNDTRQIINEKVPVCNYMT